MKLENLIPFEKKEFRPYQKCAIEKTLEAIDNGKETIILNAPTGFGKSLVAYCIAKSLAYDNEKSYIYTKTTFLQDQYLKDFKDLKTAMGRSNFKCLMSEDDFTCDIGVCKRKKGYHCPIGATVTSNVELKDISDTDYESNCLYWKQKYEAIQNDISILNYPYMIADNLYTHHFTPRKLGIFDEGHSLEQTLMSALEVEISDYSIKRDLDMDLILHDYIGDWINDLFKFSDEYKDLSDGISDVKKRDSYIKRAEALKTCAKSLEKDLDNWVFNSNNKRNRHLQRWIHYVTFKPIEIQDYTHILFDKVDYKLIMSGSILKPDIFSYELGLDDFEYIEIPSIVPPKQRPIYRQYVGSMSRSNIDNTFPFLIEKIRELAEKHDDEKGLIHSHSYNLNYKLYQEFKDDDRFIFHTQENRVDKTNEFKEYSDDEPYIFVSPYSFEGVDFPYGQARWQVICKMPYPYLGDAQVRARMDMDRRENTTDWGWCNRVVALTLSQMYGRTNRAIDDYSVTYLLDKDINRYLGPATLVTDYFLEGIVDYNYDTPLKVVDVSKIKSRGANRDNQMIILGDIKNGLNTMNKLRRAYKQLPSSSYTLVKPAVDYLLHCGAIKYDE